jgi:hypothetical protein
MALARGNWNRSTDVWVGIGLVLLLVVTAFAVLRPSDSTGSVERGEVPGAGRMISKLDDDRCRETMFNNQTGEIIREGIGACRRQGNRSNRASGSDLLEGVKRAINRH